MKKKNVINLIKYHTENNEAGFRTEAYEIAKSFDRIGDYQLAEYIMALLSNANAFVPQMPEMSSGFFEKIQGENGPLPLSEEIEHDVLGVINAISKNMGINKYLFQGPPGTGKTETTKQIARILNRDLFAVEFTTVIDSKLGQTQKNIAALFSEINNLAHPEKAIVLFDEIDAIALDRTNSSDLREMGRAVSTILKELDRLDSRVVLIATTNLYKHFDKAIIRRFDSVIDFSRYSTEDLRDISEILLNDCLSKYKEAGRNIRLFRKIISLANPLPYPGTIKNMIRSAVAFSNPNEEFDYLRRLYKEIGNNKEMDIKIMQEQGFTLREIEVFTGISKSQVARTLKEQ